MRTLEKTNRFQREYKQMKARGKDMSKFVAVLELLLNDEDLPLKYKDHKLKGNYIGWRELHIEPDWLLIYKITSTEIWLDGMGTHADLFSK